MSDMQWPGRIGRNKLDLYLLAFTHIATTIIIALLKHLLDQGLVKTAAQKEINKTRPGNFDTLDQLVINAIDDFLRQLARWHGCLLGTSQCQIGGKITLCGILALSDLGRKLECFG